MKEDAGPALYSIRAFTVSTPQHYYCHYYYYYYYYYFYDYDYSEALPLCF